MTFVSLVNGLFNCKRKKNGLGFWAWLSLKFCYVMRCYFLFLRLIWQAKLIVFHMMNSVLVYL